MKRKSMKKVVTMLMGMAMTVTLFTAAVPANACGEEKSAAVVETVVAPRAVACPHCGSSVGRHTSTTWTDWYSVQQKTCTHMNWGVDIEMRREGIELVVCSQCNSKISKRTLVDTKIDCHGFN